VSVLASPGVFGFSRLLARIPWSYLVAQAYAAKPSASEHRLVVANTDPPESLRLEQLNEWSGRSDASTRVLEHAAATLSRLKQELPGATDVELYMHGLQRAMDAEGPYLALTPDRDAGGEFKLTAQFLRPLELSGAPYVYLKACRAADAGLQNYANRSLAEAFVERGARAVFAATVPIPDREADQFFDNIRERIRAGKAPAVALAEARGEYIPAADEKDWISDVVALEPAPLRR
jgi:CHAT domain